MLKSTKLIGFNDINYLKALLYKTLLMELTCGVKLNCKAISISELVNKIRPPVFRLKFVYSYVIEVTDSEY